jgi:adenylate kinase family enzyme
MSDENQAFRIHMKIAIIGNAGSGKSDLGLKLHKISDIPLHHLDQYFWKSGWQKPDYDEFEKVHNQLCDQQAWIIEGMNTRIAEYRINQADIVIFLDFPRYLCFYRVFKRAIGNFGKVIFSSAPGCREGIPSLEFLRFIWNFDQKQRLRILDLLEKYKNKKQIFVIKNKAQLNTLLANLSERQNN